MTNMMIFALLEVAFGIASLLSPDATLATIFFVGVTISYIGVLYFYFTNRR